MDKTIEQQLKPCPFCGAAVSGETEVGSTFRWRRVVGCCTPGPEVRQDTMAQDPAVATMDAHRRAIEAWNTRPAPSDEEVGAGCPVHEKHCNLLHPATLGTDEDCCDCSAKNKQPEAR